MTMPRFLRISKALAATALVSALAPVTAQADVWCTMTGITILTYDHGGTYLDGVIDGTPRGHIDICGRAAGNVQDCNSKATERRLGVVLAAQATARPLGLYFTGLSSCTQVASYMTPTIIASYE